MRGDFKWRRRKLLNWHYKKMGTLGVFDLLESDYQSFRYRVINRVGKILCFRDAIKQATDEELYDLENIRDEKRLKI